MEPPAEVDDAALIRGTLAGRREDFDLLVERYQKPLYAFAYRLLHDHAQAADIVQVTFLQAYTHLGQFAARASFKTWLHQIALNQCRAARRRGAARRWVRLDDVNEAALCESSTESQAGSVGWPGILAQLIARLPARQQAVVTLRILGDLPFKDVARAERISENAAKVNYHHAITRLRHWLEESKR